MHLAKLAAAALLVLVTAVHGLAARGRPAAPYGRAKRSLRQSGGEDTGRKPHAAIQRQVAVLTAVHQPVL